MPIFAQRFGFHQRGLPFKVASQLPASLKDPFGFIKGRCTRARYRPSAPASRSYAILVAGDATDHIRDVHGGLGGVFEKMLRDPGETWRSFHLLKNEFPSEEHLHQYEGFVITGSRHDAHSNDPWVTELCELVRKLHKERIKLLGICFGHQVISRALGGKTGRSVYGWEVGLRKITFLDALNAKPYASKVPASATIVEIHQDQVHELPPNAELLAQSEKTSAEMYAVGDHVFCIQGHPEFTEDIVENILNVCQQNQLMPEKVISEARLSLKDAKADYELFKQLCKSFLKQASLRIETSKC